MSSGLMSPGEVPVDEDSLQDLYAWIDEIPLSRPKKNITRDFSDGVLVAEIVHNFLPKMVELHNYSPANAQTQKLTNWNTLNRKVFGKLNYTVSDSVVKAVSNCKPGSIEQVLFNLRGKIEKYEAKRKAQALRDQQQMYDEFSPDGPVGEHNSHLYSDGYSTNGPENNYGYAFNTRPLDMGRYGAGYPGQQQPEGFHPGAPPAMPSSGPRVGESGPSAMHGVEEPPKGSAMKLRPRVSSYATDKGRMNMPPQKGKVPRAQSFQDVANGDQPNVRLLLEEKEQALLASQETIQILQAKVRRLEHLLHLKDIRIDDLSKRLQQASHPPPRQLPPQQNPPQPVQGDQGFNPAMMQIPYQPPLPPLQYHTQQPQ